MGRSAIDLTGIVFGRWTVIKRDSSKNADPHVYWVCECSCGNSNSVPSTALRNGKSKGCINCRLPRCELCIKIHREKHRKISE
jgi:hypothetical protein